MFSEEQDKALEKGDKNQEGNFDTYFKVQLTTESFGTNDEVDFQPTKKEYNDREIYLITRTQASWRTFTERKKFKITLKKLKQRKCVVEELARTEELYIESLNVIKSVILDPLQNDENRRYLDKSKIDTIFSTLIIILEYNKKFFKEIKKKQEQYTPNSLFADSVLQFMDFFKVYTFYCQNFDDSRKELEKLKRENHPFLRWVKEMEFTPQFQNLDLSSLLVKPVQRLPKYVLLFKELLKNTEEIHPDYNNIKQVLEKFLVLNKINNEKMEQYLKSEKLCELEKLFGASTEILNSKRQFIFEESLQFILDDIPKMAICYFLTDLVLITERNSKTQQYQVLQVMRMNEYSYLRNNKDTKYFSHLFTVYGKEGAFTFGCESSESKKKLMDKIEQEIIQPLSQKAESKFIAISTIGHKDNDEIRQSLIIKKSSQQVEIKVLGSFNRTIQSVLPKTTYVIEITKESIRHKLLLLFEDLVEVEELVHKEFPNVKTSNLSGQKKMFSNRGAKTIECRKIHIENFLQTILNHDSVLEKGKQILQRLGLPLDFLDSQDSPSRIRDFTMFYNSECSNIENKGSYEVMDMILKPMSNYLYSSSFQNTESPSNVEKFNTQVKLMNGRIIEVECNQYTKSIEICDFISKKLELMSGFDFRLFMVNEKNEERVLDDYELLYRLLKVDQESQSQEGCSFFKNVKKNFKKAVNYFEQKFNPNIHFVFKKHIYLYLKLEENDLKKDPIRMQILTHQIFNEMKNCKYYFSFNDFAKMNALRCLFLYGRFNEKEAEANLKQTMAEGLPLKIFQSKPKTFWRDSIRDYWKSIQTRLDDIESKKRTSLEVDKDGVESKTSPKDKISLTASILTINIIKSHSLFGANIYPVQVFKVGKKDPKEKGTEEKNYEDWVWIAIRFEAILFLNGSKQQIAIFDIGEIKDFICYSSNVVLELNKNSLRLDSDRSYEIFQLIDEYKKIKFYTDAVKS